VLGNRRIRGRPIRAAFDPAHDGLTPQPEVSMEACLEWLCDTDATPEITPEDQRRETARSSLLARMSSVRSDHPLLWAVHLTLTGAAVISLDRTTGHEHHGPGAQLSPEASFECRHET
jgi:hypothetical protein